MVVSAQRLKNKKAGAQGKVQPKSKAIRYHSGCWLALVVHLKSAQEIRQMCSYQHFIVTKAVRPGVSRYCQYQVARISTGVHHSQ